MKCLNSLMYRIIPLLSSPENMENIWEDKLYTVVGSSDGEFVGDRNIIRNFETNLINYHPTAKAH